MESNKRADSISRWYERLKKYDRMVTKRGKLCKEMKIESVLSLNVKIAIDTALCNDLDEMSFLQDLERWIKERFQHFSGTYIELSCEGYQINCDRDDTSQEYCTQKRTLSSHLQTPLPRHHQQEILIVHQISVPNTEEEIDNNLFQRLRTSPEENADYWRKKAKGQL